MFNKNSNITEEDFLQNYWQQKPILLKNVFSDDDFKNFPTPNELAGMSLDGVAARIIKGDYQKNDWQIITQPFDEDVFSTLPDKNWTLLVQGVDRFIPKVYDFVKNFDFIPRWKFDDVMMSYAEVGGSVGPHFDYYDVFLVQTSGSRRWRLSSKNCNDGNYNPNFALKIMDNFETEMDIITEVGDVLYVPPRVAHFGESLSDDCTTTSVGYRAYSADELSDYAESAVKKTGYYADPKWNNDKNWNSDKTPALITKQAIKNANDLTKISDGDFAEFITKTDLFDEELLQEQSQEQELEDFDKNKTYQLSSCIKVAYLEDERVFIAGVEFEYDKKYTKTLIDFCNSREIPGNFELTKQLFALGILV
jgi:50S ribosomal protein L16 3-hydroxylase